jgi:hypothetical protein
MDFKHKSSLPSNGNYMENVYQPSYKPPYNESMLHHINTSQKEPQHMSVYEMSALHHHHQQQQQLQKYTMPAKSNYQYRSPNSLRLRRRCRSECLSPVRGAHYQYNNARSGQSPSSNGYHHQQQQQDMWHQRQQQQHHEQASHYDYNKHEISGVNGYKYRFNNLQVDGKSVQFEHFDSNDDYDYYTWHENRRLRARSESASQDYYYRTNYLDDFGDNSAKRSRELAYAKERRSPSHRSVTNPKNNVSVLVNNSSNHFRYSPKTKTRSHHASLKIGGSLVRGSSPLHKARLWKNQNSSSSLVHSPESSFTNGSSSNSSSNFNGTSSTNMQQNHSCSSKSKHEEIDFDEDDDDDDDDDDEEEPPMPMPGNQIIDDDMTDPEDNYESSLSLSSSERSLAFNCAKNLTINTECVHGGRVLQAPLAPSLFPFVPPYISFATFEDKGPDMPPAIHKILKWKLTTITPLLVRKVLLNTGFRLMKSE